MNIIVDAMGGDYAPNEIIKGCIQAVDEYNTNISLVGQENLIKKQLSILNADVSRFEIINADDIILPDDNPVSAIKNKKESSMVKGLEMIKKDPHSVFISAGNTGALMAGSILKVGRIKGIDRPALATFMINTANKGGSLLIDGGANADCKPDNLVQFAIMGSIYMEKVLGRIDPTVGLINIGIEDTKGNQLTKKVYTLLKDCRYINFAGNVEARDIPRGHADILVCDGFVGNVVLKLTEGVASTLFDMLKEEMTANWTRKLGTLLLKPGLKNFKKKMDYAEYGGAPLLGVNGGIIKAHGSSNAKAIKNAIRQGLLFMENGVLDTIANSIEHEKEE
ncbi:phosphate acyltransferase PlsX [Xylanivirga thermophila]|uniref:phosphate acyltransferase PlsX n=1 Tax=Xylanivirga thermophila TaxID=2496273 RepID=UPI00101CE6BF|nr:phosphate acyltransferase PlsX [Xylanivirga thermophila]